MRNFILAALALVVLLLWQAWQEDYKKEQSSPAAEITEDFSPVLKRTNNTATVPGRHTTDPGQRTNNTEQARDIEISTDFYSGKISLRGGNITELYLKEFQKTLGTEEGLFLLLSEEEGKTHVVQGGIIDGNTDQADHRARYESQKSHYQMAEEDDVLEVPLVWRTDSGRTIEKRYHFKRGSYLVRVSYQLNNNAATQWEAREYAQIRRHPTKQHFFATTYQGPALWSPDDHYQKIGFDKVEKKPLDREITAGWVAMLQHYFISALIPPSQEESQRYYAKKLSAGKYVVGAISAPQIIAPGEAGTFQRYLFLGPKLQSAFEAAEVKQLAPKLFLTTDYGPLWFIAAPLFKCLNWLHKYLGNWGLAIVFLTMFIKLAFYKLSAMGYRSMAKMRVMQPKIKTLQARFKKDKAAMQQAMIKLYREEKINPLGAFFPFLLQIPVFLSLYWMLLESVELRHAGFILWIIDLSSPDPLYILPVLMGVSMFVQQRLNPAPADPLHQKIMNTMLIVFAVLFAFFPAGLVLYWLTNNLLSIPQQWLITRSQSQAAGRGKQQPTAPITKQ